MKDIEHKGLFDRLAEWASGQASRAWFFVSCVAIVVVWAPTIAVLGNVDTWQLIINTLTTIITFLLVALLQNSQWRSDVAVQRKLDAVATGLRDLMDHEAHKACDYEGCDFYDDIAELERAVGIEDRVGTR